MEVLALNVLHRDELGPASFPKIEDADDVPVSNLARKDQLLLEAQQNFRIIGQLGLDDFERDLSLQLDISRFVNCPHAAFAEDFDDFVAVRKDSSRPKSCAAPCAARGICAIA